MPCPFKNKAYRLDIDLFIYMYVPFSCLPHRACCYQEGARRGNASSSRSHRTRAWVHERKLGGEVEQREGSINIVVHFAFAFEGIVNRALDSFFKIKTLGSAQCCYVVLKSFLIEFVIDFNSVWGLSGWWGWWWASQERSQEDHAPSLQSEPGHSAEWNDSLSTQSGEL